MSERRWLKWAISVFRRFAFGLIFSDVSRRRLYFLSIQIHIAMPDSYGIPLSMDFPRQFFLFHFLIVITIVFSHAFCMRNTHNVKDTRSRFACVAKSPFVTLHNIYLYIYECSMCIRHEPNSCGWKVKFFSFSIYAPPHSIAPPLHTAPARVFLFGSQFFSTARSHKREWPIELFKHFILHPKKRNNEPPKNKMQPQI